MHEVIYYDNAATSWPKPPAVAQRMADFLAHEAANPGRAGHRMAIGAEKMLDNVRQKLTQFIGGTDLHRMILCLNGTDALNIAFKGLLRAGDHVITSTLEHNSVSRPLQAMADAGFITLTRIDFSPSTGVIDPEDVKRAITPQTRLIALTHASNVVGVIQPITAVGAIARAHTVRFLVDAAQTIGAVPISVADSYIDFLAFPGHKSLLGPTGTGGLYVNTTVPLEALKPFREGGTGGDSSSPTMPRQFPYFLEGGTPNTVGIAGLGAALDYVTSQPAGAVLAHEQAQVQKIIEVLGTLANCTLYGPPSARQRVGTLCFNLAGYTPHEVGSILDENFTIAVRPGLHCAPYAHKTLGTFPDGAIRISPGAFNTAVHLDALIRALQELHN